MNDEGQENTGMATRQFCRRLSVDPISNPSKRQASGLLSAHRRAGGLFAAHRLLVPVAHFRIEREYGVTVQV